MNEIRGDVLTKARSDKKDVMIIEGKRGGVSFLVESYLDVLLENETITKSQLEYGNAFWSARDTAFHELKVKTGRLQYVSDPDEEEIPDEQVLELAEEGMATELYRALLRNIHPAYVKAINAACNTVQGPRMAIFWAFNESTISDAFNRLEAIFDKSKDEALLRIKNPYPKESACTAL